MVDTREQAPWFQDLVHVRAALPTGDVSALGLHGQVAIERKSAEDFIASVTRERPRFLLEVERLGRLAFGAIIVEASTCDIELACEAAGRSVSAWSVLASALAFTCDHRVPVLFAGSRSHAERMALWILRRWLQRTHGRVGDPLRLGGEGVGR